MLKYEEYVVFVIGILKCKLFFRRFELKDLYCVFVGLIDF